MLARLGGLRVTRSVGAPRGDSPYPPLDQECRPVVGPATRGNLVYRLMSGIPAVALMVARVPGGFPGTVPEAVAPPNAPPVRHPDGRSRTGAVPPENHVALVGEIAAGLEATVPPPGSTCRTMPSRPSARGRGSPRMIAGRVRTLWRNPTMAMVRDGSTTGSFRWRRCPGSTHASDGGSGKQASALACGWNGAPAPPRPLLVPRPVDRPGYVPEGTSWGNGEGPGRLPCKSRGPLVPEVGLEPTRVSPPHFECGASAIPPLGPARGPADGTGRQDR